MWLSPIHILIGSSPLKTPNKRLKNFPAPIQAPANPTTTTTIITDGVAGATTFTFTHTAALVGGQTVLEAFNAALVANPGGLVSTLGKPIATQQVPAPQSGQVGRMVVASAPVFVQYASVAIA